MISSILLKHGWQAEILSFSRVSIPFSTMPGLDSQHDLLCSSRKNVFPVKSS